MIVRLMNIIRRLISVISQNRFFYADRGPTINIVDHNRIEKANDFYLKADIGTNKYFATLICPQCNDLIPITSNHTKIIDKDGKISLDPSVLHEDCGAHFFVKENIIYFV